MGETGTVHRTEYTQRVGERAERKIPAESGILKGQGTFASETQQRAEFGPKRAERMTAVRPADSDLFKVGENNK